MTAASGIVHEEKHEHDDEQVECDDEQYVRGNGW
jgi:redox-sensitive bicupin YhaK (pirin superfamily)